MSTPYHACYYSHNLQRRSAGGEIDRLSMSLFDASVDLTPHQVDAALFVFQSPLSKGAILADEVGLGKTIEAGLVLCQLWAERKRRLLIICPASIRKQWSMELDEKFNLPAIILESKNYNQFVREGNDNPFQQAGIVITSMNFASRMKNDIRTIPWDMVVIDEAHKLRNAYRLSNRMGQAIKWAVEDCKKVLLTATPLQNSLLELYGLSTIIDEHLFGDVKAFRNQFINDSDFDELRERLKYFCKRTLRNQVIEYIRYTKRKAVTIPFSPGNDEQKLYESIAKFLQREDNYAIPHRQRTLTTLVLWKLLASSSTAVAGTLMTIKDRLERMRDELSVDDDITFSIIEQEELAEDLLDEELDEPEDLKAEDSADKTVSNNTLDKRKLEAEITELDGYIKQAQNIGTDSKSESLLTALDIGFQELEKMGANRKALIFTESRRTQEYLFYFLETHGYKARMVLFNGSNTDPLSKDVFNQWLEKNKGNDRISGSATADKRVALIEYFRDYADIMIATESAAEGINLQFCSLVINYDLPWNPQRIEQRIGRCHRYGQQHDVVVINFLNNRNQADIRVYQLLQEKFNLFSGVFGASDEVLGTIESGIDFERKILKIYQQCRTPEEINTAFAVLQSEMEAIINSRMEDTRRTLLENFDEDVHQRLKIQHDKTQYHLDKLGKQFWSLTRFILERKAEFHNQELSFNLLETPGKDIKTGKYVMISRDSKPDNNFHLYRLSHPLGEYVIDQGLNQNTPPAEIVFDISSHPARISAIEDLKGQSGYLVLSQLSIESLENEDHLLFNAYTDDGQMLDQELCEKLFQCGGQVKKLLDINNEHQQRLQDEAQIHARGSLNRSMEKSNRYFQQERNRLDKWADDMILSAEQELKDTRAKIKMVKREARNAVGLEEQLRCEKKLQELNRALRKQRQQIFDVEDEIMEKRDQLIAELESKMVKRTTHEILFTIRFHVI